MHWNKEADRPLPYSILYISIDFVLHEKLILTHLLNVQLCIELCIYVFTGLRVCEQINPVYEKVLRL